MIGTAWGEALAGLACVYIPRLRAWWTRNEINWLLLVIVLVILLPLLAGCAPTRTVYVDRPGPERIVERKVYVAIPDALLPHYPIATGPLAQCPIVARARKTVLEQAQDNTEAIRQIRGQPAEPVATP